MKSLLHNNIRSFEESFSDKYCSRTGGAAYFGEGTKADNWRKIWADAYLKENIRRGREGGAH